MMPRALLCFSALLSSLALPLSLFAQAPSAADAETNRAAFGQIVQMRSFSPADVKMRSAMHIQKLQELSRGITLETDPAKKKQMIVDQSTQALHMMLEERVAPHLTDRTPAIEVGSVMTLPNPALNHVLMWNHAALDLTSLDFSTPGDALPHPEFGEQLGPPCTSRAMGMVHLAIFEALNAIEQKYPSYRGTGQTGSIQAKVFTKLSLLPANVSVSTYDENTAVEAAAYDLLAKLYPHKSGFLDAVYRDPDTTAIASGAGAPTPAMIANGAALGTAIAEEIILERTGDGALAVAGGPPHPFGLCVSGGAYATLPPPPSTTPDLWLWKPDPVRQPTANKGALGSNWATVTPFVIQNVPTYRPAPLVFTSQMFQDSVVLSRLVGGDPMPPPSPTSVGAVATPTLRTPEQTEIGTFWAYDGTAGLCAPPRLYNMIVTSIATGEKPVTNALEMARLLALANVAMADAAIAAWDSKYFYRVARPVTSLRGITEGTTHPNATWTPLGAPSSNGVTYNVTPPFPAYPSGHATFGGALFQVLRDFYHVDGDDSGTAFVFVSDEFNGFNQDPRTQRNRPLRARHFNSFRQAESENAMSRVYLGIHWSVDADAGIQQGNKVGDAIAQTLYLQP